MELSGNLWERVVTVGNATGRTFSGVHGNGTLTAGGAADVSGWPAAAGTGWKGGSWFNTTTNSATTSDRAQAAIADNTRAADAGGRGVRTISSGILTDGLVLWLDAGIAPSYPGSGTAWTDLSGNKNNGTLTNGPTYSSANWGAIVFDGGNDFAIVSLPSFTSYNTFTYNVWVYSTNNSGYRTIIDQGNDTWFFGTNLGELITYNPNLNSGYVININQWYNLGVTHVIGGPILFYVNGNLVYTSTNNSSNFSTSYFGIGAGVTSPTLADEVWSGNIAVAQIYNRALSAAEVLQNFNAQKARFGL
jgi:hypothetical protein